MNLTDFSGLLEQIKPVSTFLGLAESNRWSLGTLSSHFFVAFLNGSSYMILPGKGIFLEQ